MDYLFLLASALHFMMGFNFGEELLNLISNKLTDSCLTVIQLLNHIKADYGLTFVYVKSFTVVLNHNL